DEPLAAVDSRCESWRIPIGGEYNENRAMSRSHRTSGPIRRVGAAFIGIAICGLLRSPPAVSADETADEIRLGAQIAKEIESHYRVVTDPAMVDRLARVGDALVPVVDRQDLTYHFRVIDIPGVNALGVPGGRVYVTRGMMKFVRSDHELAAVLAHELTHVAHRHYYVQQARESRMAPALVIAAALSVLARSAAPIVGVSLATQGAMANYQRDLEKEADLTGISYLTKTSYSPVAMLTLMEHLAQGLAARLNAFVNTDPAPYDVRDVISPGRWTVIGGQTELFEVTPEDAAYENGSPKAVAEGLRARLAEALAEAPYYRKF